ncbi:thermonuclease family protein [Mesorhizobium xinjiangense]|uniref:thermonuclease family protein n=1 Tax=Mesorhizobium xinjiangense TaxID=2678685 RepID=UPI001F35EC66|nr:thermonuclease family protein [Mesorhizobium xinjiangense]
MERRRGRPARRSGGFRRVVDLAAAAVLVGLLALIATRLDRVATRSWTGDAVIHDGDTLSLDGQRIRLRGIDAPELDQDCAGPQGRYRCGRRAKQELQRLATAGPVTCDGWERDRYDRLLATCSAGGVDLNGAMVAAGWAVAYGGYRMAESMARAGGKGLWAGTFDRPGDWRRMKGAMVEPEHHLLARLVNWLRAMIGTQ